MRKIQTQGVHHITLIGATRQATIDFWEGVLGMPFIFEQPNLDVPEENHLYFDPGDGRLITVFTREDRPIDPSPNPEQIGVLHHLAFNVSRATYTQVAKRLKERGIPNSGEVDRGFMYSIYFRDPLGQLLELANYRFDRPASSHRTGAAGSPQALRVARGGYNAQRRARVRRHRTAGPAHGLVVRGSAQPPRGRVDYRVVGVVGLNRLAVTHRAWVGQQYAEHERVQGVVGRRWSVARSLHIEPSCYSPLILVT
ncbi:MAG: VOC family protein [Caldilineaceae bacterium]